MHRRRGTLGGGIPRGILRRDDQRLRRSRERHGVDGGCVFGEVERHRLHANRGEAVGDGDRIAPLAGDDGQVLDAEGRDRLAADCLCHFQKAAVGRDREGFRRVAAPHLERIASGACLDRLAGQIGDHSKESVAARAAVERVEPGPAVEVVVAEAADQPVVPRSADERVVAGTAVEHDLPTPARRQLVIAAAAESSHRQREALGQREFVIAFAEIGLHPADALVDLAIAERLDPHLAASQICELVVLIRRSRRDGALGDPAADVEIEGAILLERGELGRRRRENAHRDRDRGDLASRTDASQEPEAHASLGVEREDGV